MNYLSQQNPADFEGKRVLLRLDLNVPVEGGKIAESDADRIKKSMPTIDWLKNAGAKTIIISHIGRDPQETLQPVADYMNMPLSKDFEVGDLENGQVVMMENLRSNPGEEGNDEVFAAGLAKLADVYVNDAFAVSHRAHASLVTIPKLLPAYCGLQMESEIENLSKSFNPESPSVLVLGGAKFETKLPVIQKFLNIVDHIVIGGALANNFYRAMGYEIGKSLVDETADVSGLVGNPKIIVPLKVMVENEQNTEEKLASSVEMGDKIVDIAPDAFDAHAELFSTAKFILWNGPMGNYENGFTAGSEKIAQLIADAGSNGAHTIVGGGDSVALIEQLGIADKFSFISTGGGAMLEYLANGTLPGIVVLD